MKGTPRLGKSSTLPSLPFAGAFLWLATTGQECSLLRCAMCFPFALDFQVPRRSHESLFPKVVVVSTAGITPRSQGRRAYQHRGWSNNKNIPSPVSFSLVILPDCGVTDALHKTHATANDNTNVMYVHNGEFVVAGLWVFCPSYVLFYLADRFQVCFDVTFNPFPHASWPQSALCRFF